jgi:3-oxoacyl-[acyl-carrier-protein] synthase-3
MAFLDINNVAIRGISASVPRQTIENRDIYQQSWGDVEDFMSTTGIERHRNSPKGICSSDLCVSATEELLRQLGWEKESIGAIVFVTQTPDYLEPATSCILQNRLGLSTDCMTIDISLGCSGWVHAFSVLSALMQNGTIKRGLLLAGDTPSKNCSVNDKSTFPLFGDAGTATALEYDETASKISFILNTDGEGFNVIIIPEGGYRNQVTPESLIEKEHGDGIVSSGVHVAMDGMSVFSFAISKAPKSIKTIAEKKGVDLEKVDYILLHQANLFMNEKIRKKLKLTPEQVPYSLKDFGNTSCASIPLTIVTQCKEKYKLEKLTSIGCGFGIGLSWGSVYFDTDHIVVPDLIEL